MIWIPYLSPQQEQIITLVYRKDNYRGYMLPQLEVNSSTEFKFMEPIYSDLLPLGRFNVTLVKNLTNNNVVHGTVFEISLTLTNYGNIELGNFSISDTECYDTEGFTLEDGFMIKNYAILQPGESVTFTYSLRTLNKNGIFAINPAKVEYFHINRNLIESQAMTIMVRQTYFESILILILPIMAGASVIIFTYYKKTQYSREDLEIERRESLLFGQSMREIAWKKKNLVEFLDEQTLEEKK